VIIDAGHDPPRTNSGCNEPRNLMRHVEF
jgi:hypothetical protein